MTTIKANLLDIGCLEIFVIWQIFAAFEPLFHLGLRSVVGESTDCQNSGNDHGRCPVQILTAAA